MNSIADSEADLVLGLLRPGGARGLGRRPSWIIANRFLTTIENWTPDTPPCPNCTPAIGPSAGTSSETIQFLCSSNDFVFDTQVLALAAVVGIDIVEVPSRRST